MLVSWMHDHADPLNVSIGKIRNCAPSNEK